MRTTLVPAALGLCLASCVGGEADHARSLAWNVDSTAVVAIGGADERSDYIVYGVVGATRLSDGRIAVASQGASRISYYSHEGQHLYSAGGPGSGPGEYEAVFAAHRTANDSILVISRRPGFTWLGPDGEYVRSVGAPVETSRNDPCRIHGDLTWYGAGANRLVKILEENSGPGCGERSRGGIRRPTGLVELSVAGSGQSDTLAILPATERNGAYYRVFGSSLLVAAGPGIVAVMDNAADSIVVHDLDTGESEAWPSPFARREVPVEAKRSEGRDVVPGGDPALFPVAFDFPDHYPAAGRLLFDGAGQLWVMAYPEFLAPTEAHQVNLLHGFRLDGLETQWRVLGVTGEVVAEVTMPPGLYAVEIGSDYVLGVSKDTFGVETVQLHRLGRE